MVSDKCCRLCLHDLNLEGISIQNIKINELYDTIVDLFNIEIKENDFCRLICRNCYETVLKFKEYKLKVVECQKIIEDYNFLKKCSNTDDKLIPEKSITQLTVNGRISSNQLKAKKLEATTCISSNRELRSQKPLSGKIKINKINSIKTKTNGTSNKKLLTKEQKKLKLIPITKKNILRKILIKLLKLQNNDIDLRLLDDKQNPIDVNKLTYTEVEELHESIILPEIWSSFLNCFQNKRVSRGTKEKLKVILNKSEYEKIIHV